MAIVDYEYYSKLYEEPMQEAVFNRLIWNAEKKVDAKTLCVDGFSKLRNAFPTDEYHVECIKRCICEVLTVMKKIEDAERSVSSANAIVTDEKGTHKGLVSSVSSGSESISYSTNTGSATLIEKVLADKTAQEELYTDIINTTLAGVEDKNSVLMLYTGIYPA